MGRLKEIVHRHLEGMELMTRVFGDWPLPAIAEECAEAEISDVIEMIHTLNQARNAYMIEEPWDGDGADDYWRDMERFADLFGLLSEKWPRECLQIFHHTDSGVIFWAAIAYAKHPTRLAIEPLKNAIMSGQSNERALRAALRACERF